MFELGFPLLRVELSDDILDYIITKQISYYTINFPYVKTLTLRVQQNTSEIELKDDEGREILGIGMIVTESMGQGMRYFGIPRQYDLRQLQDELKLRILKWQYTEIIVKDVMGTVYTFRFNPETSIVTFTPPVNNTVLILYYTTYKSVNEIKPSGKKWIFKYSLQLQKQYLGRVRSKYSGINTLMGQLNTDGETLLNEQNEEIRTLEEELKNSRTTYLRHLQFIG